MGMTAPLIETERMRWGLILQEPIARTWATDSGLRVRQRLVTDYHPTHSFMFSHGDFDIVGRPEAVEIKTTSEYNNDEWGERDSDQIPADYLLQVMHQMACRPRIERIHVVVLFGGQRLGHYVVERDEETIRNLELVEEKFWLDHVVTKVPPDADGSEGATVMLTALHPQDNGVVIELDDELADLGRQYLAHHESEKAGKEGKALVGNLIRERMGDAYRAQGGDVKITWSSFDQSKTDWRALAEELGATPTLIKQFTTKSPQRRLTVTAQAA